MTPLPTSTLAVEEAPSLAVRCVRALLDRHGLRKYRQSTWLADAIGLSYAQAHRKMNGGATWTLEDIERVAALFGESLAEVVSLAQGQGSLPAVMRIGGATVPCELWIGAVVEHPQPDSLVAIRTSSGWTALSASEAGGQSTYVIERLHAKPSAAQRKLVAVLDDDENLTNSICSLLQERGYATRPFYKTADLQASVKELHYDAYVIDWIVGETSTVKLIGALRAHDATCPIVVLTAQVLTGVVQEAEIAAAVSNFNLVFAEKPVRMAILSASLARAFASK